MYNDRKKLFPFLFQSHQIRKIFHTTPKIQFLMALFTRSQNRTADEDVDLVGNHAGHHSVTNLIHKSLTPRARSRAVVPVVARVEDVAISALSGLEWGAVRRARVVVEAVQNPSRTAPIPIPPHPEPATDPSGPAKKKGYLIHQMGYNGLNVN